MALLIGMDEAGLGPNLGPFVVAATVWQVPGPPHEFDFWSAFDTVLTNEPGDDDPRLHIADSKQVFQPQRGVGALERGVCSALSLCGIAAESFASLCTSLRPQTPAAPKPEKAAGRKRPSNLFDDSELAAARSPSDTSCIDEDHVQLPWYGGDGCALPVEPGDLSLATEWSRTCERLGVRLVEVRAEVVEPLRFNRLVRRYDNKSQATSRLAMNLLRSVWQPDDEPALIVADKHGGRNRYDLLLSEAFQQPLECVEEGAEQSIYRLGNGELRFQPRAECHGPVALASMTAKYVREVAMHQFNRFWKLHIPDLKPTQGYPLDARRFRDEIADTQKSLRISDDVLWRER